MARKKSQNLQQPDWELLSSSLAASQNPLQLARQLALWVRRHAVPIDGLVLRLPDGRSFRGWGPQPRQPSHNPSPSAARQGRSTRLRLRLETHSGKVGWLEVERRRPAKFLASEKKRLKELAGVIALAVEYALLRAEFDRREKAQTRELDLARQIQVGLLPGRLRMPTDIDLAAQFLPALEVGGDFFDYFFLHHRYLHFYVGDAAGKGLSAAFYAALVSGVLRGIHKAEQAPARILWFLNDRLGLREAPGMFCTLCYGILDRETSRLSLSNAGLPATLCRNGGGIEAVPASGPPLGLFEASQYQDWTGELRTGDTFVVHTDGLSDAWNHHGDQFGVEGVYEVLAQTRSQTAQEIADQILQAMARFSGKGLARDDIAMLVLKRS